MTTTINNEHKKLNVPNLRFKEFEGEWEKCKLSEICTFFSGGTPSSSNWKNRSRLGQCAGADWDTFDAAKLMIFSETVAF